ncbi:MAG TPA: transcription termination factor Rho [Opitutaceae bacterium]|nr:transcription termination factor Rho [Opitutaceae bacterium]
MSLPPKSDDESSAPEGAKPVKRSRLTRSKKTTASPAAPKQEERQQEIFVPERRPEPERKPEPEQRREPEPSQESAPQQQDHGPQDDGGNRDIGTDGSGPAQQGGGGQGGRHDGGGQRHGGGGGGQGEWQDRNSWKRNKRKRGRHGGGGGGGSWQGGGGGGGGGGQNRFPAQPAPPSAPQSYGDLPDPARFDDLVALDALAKEIAPKKSDPLYLDHLYSLPLAELTALARQLEVKFEGAPNRLQLLPQIFTKATEEKRAIIDRGYVDMTDQGAFLVHEHVNYRLYPEDAYLPESLIRRFGLKRGHKIEALIQPPRDGERCPSVIRIDTVMGNDPEEISKVTPFEELVPYYPLKRILLEDVDIQKDVSMRVVDILTPIGFGQRGLIVAPPRTGKTILLQNIANSISENSPFAKLILLLVDERPEEVTDFRRHTKGEVVSSTFDEAPESHVHCAEMVGEKARRLVEQGEHVVILLDSITRLARAYNALAGSGGKIMSGGLESNALQKPKRFFGAARNIEGAGSLTIIATALVDTGSRADEIIFEEFKGTGNMELHLDRGLVERRIFPSVNIDRSGTRKEELIYHPEELQRIYGLRRAMQGLGPIESMEMLIQRLKKTKSNAEFLLSLSRQ